MEYVYPNGVRALSALNVTIQKGEFAFLAGPTGSGKSTLLKLIYRELKPTRGEVFVDGVDVGNLPSSRVPYLRRTIGMIFEDFKLLKGRSVFDNVAYALEVVGAGKEEIHRKVTRALNLVGLHRKTDFKVEHLSGGEQQRTAIARAISNGSNLILADEPTGHLDQESGWDIMQLFDKIHHEGATLLVATHNLEWIERLGKRVIFLYEGETIEKFIKGAASLGASNPAILSSGTVE